MGNCTDNFQTTFRTTLQTTFNISCGRLFCIGVVAHNLHYNDCVIDGLKHCFDGVTDALRHCFDSLVDVLMHYEAGGESDDKFIEKHATSMQFS